MSLRPKLGQVDKFAATTATIDRLIVEEFGNTFEYTWPGGPRLYWEPEQKFIFWIDPPEMKVSRNRAVRPSSAADAFKDWEGVEATTEHDVELPSFRLRRAVKAVRIYYWFDRDAGYEAWHHDLDDEDRFYMGANKSGPKIFIVNGPNLQFTSRGIIN